MLCTAFVMCLQDHIILCEWHINSDQVTQVLLQNRKSVVWSLISFYLGRVNPKVQRWSFLGWCLLPCFMRYCIVWVGVRSRSTLLTKNCCTRCCPIMGWAGNCSAQCCCAGLYSFIMVLGCFTSHSMLNQILRQRVRHLYYISL